MSHAFPRRRFLAALAGTGIAGPFGTVRAATTTDPAAQDASSPTAPFVFDPNAPLIPAPRDPALWPAFRQQLAAWREAERTRLAYSDALYARPDFQWVQGNYSCGFLMLFDERLCDARNATYRVQAVLDDAREEFGGYDSVVLWHAYPRIGLDDRNQFDFYREMPGGLPGLRAAVAEFHRAGVKVFIDYNPWDTGTRRETDDDLEILARLIQVLDADGIFLDTLDRGAEGFRDRLDAARPGVVLEGEIALPLDRVHDHHCSWAQWFDDSDVPGVLRNTWFERRHRQHQVKRWNRDHSGELQSAWMNGSGILVWENVFGSWLGWSPQDRSLLRAMQPLQRRYSRVFCQGAWTPLVPTEHPDVFASLWELDDVRLWTLVNRSAQAIHGPLLSIPQAPAPSPAAHDAVIGKPARLTPREDRWLFVGEIPPRGVGCLVIDPQLATTDGQGFLERQAAVHRRASHETRSPEVAAALVPVAPTPRARRVPEGMVAIPAAQLTLRTRIRIRECGFYDPSPEPGHDWGSSYEFQVKTFDRPASIPRIAVDLTPVTNAEFARFLRASGYQPLHSQGFLKHWAHGAPPAGAEEHPVVYIDLNDARAYARWAGKRLPTEEEWQYAAQGPDGRLYPWGNEMIAGRCNGGQTGGTTPVREFPEGRSPFGIFDLCGNVWEWTESERSDGRTRFCMIRGGSYYTARGSGWYMDGGARPCDFSQKCILVWPGLDRCATVGFRCVVDLT